MTNRSAGAKLDAAGTLSGAVRQLRFRLADGERIYAIGDVHGCFDAFERLMQRIRLDAERNPAASIRLVLLGDLIDRGSRSADMVRSAMRYTRASEKFVVLMGNHEQLMVRALEGDLEALASWLNVGGAETLLSFRVAAPLVREGACPALVAAAQRQVGPDIVAWLLRLPLTLRSGDVLFVHAGVRKGIPLEKQDVRDLLWIRDEFLDDDAPRDYLVVHGHTVFSEGPDWNEHRIGVDTGAYKTGRLSAVAFEGENAWSLRSDDPL